MHSKLWIIAMAAMLSAASSAFVCAEDDTSVRSLINSQGCKACHALDGNGGIMAGSFEAMRDKLTRAQVRSQIVTPERTHGNARIPDFSHLSEQQIDALVNFIQPKP